MDDIVGRGSELGRGRRPTVPCRPLLCVVQSLDRNDGEDSDSVLFTNVVGVRRQQRKSRLL